MLFIKLKKSVSCEYKAEKRTVNIIGTEDMCFATFMKFCGISLLMKQ